MIAKEAAPGEKFLAAWVSETPSTLVKGRA
jgi:hypothetical protein